MLSDIKNLKSEFSRRAMAQMIAGLGLGVGFVAPDSLSAASAAPNRRKVVRIHLGGGMSHLDSFDPKPEVPEIMGDTKTIKSNTGEDMSAYFPQLAKRMDKFALIRSMTSTEADHARATYLTETSYPPLGTTSHPNFGAWMLKMRGSFNEDIPSLISIDGRGGGGYLGTDYAPFQVANVNDPLRGLVMKNPDSEENLKLLKLMANVRREFHKKYATEEVNSYGSFYNHSMKFMRSKELKAFDLSQESPASLAHYNMRDGKKFLLARRLLEAGIQYISIGFGGFDNHFQLWDEDNFPKRASWVDRPLAAFIDDLYARGLDKEVVFVVNTEFGRSPEITGGGRNHHRRAYSAIIGGSGVKNGTVFGKTDERGYKVVENAMHPRDLNATLATLVGLDLEKEIFSPDNRPFTVARGGKVPDGLLA